MLVRELLAEAPLERRDFADRPVDTEHAKQINDKYSADFWALGITSKGAGGEAPSIPPGKMTRAYTEKWQVPANYWGFFICSNADMKKTWYEVAEKVGLLKVEGGKPKVVFKPTDDEDYVDKWRHAVAYFRKVVMGDAKLSKVMSDEFLEFLLSTGKVDRETSKYIKGLIKDPHFAFTRAQIEKIANTKKSWHAFASELGKSKGEIAAAVGVKLAVHAGIEAGSHYAKELFDLVAKFFPTL